MNVKLINPFIEATVNALQTMAFTEPKRGTPHLKKGEECFGDISGVIGLAGEATGSVTVTFSAPLAIKIASKMLQEEISELNAEVKDAVGEIANMVAGGAKGILQQEDVTYKISTPVVVVGKDHNLATPPDVPTIIIPFEIEGDKFFVEVTMKPGG